jgi:hypothetical protein
MLHMPPGTLGQVALDLQAGIVTLLFGDVETSRMLLGRLG